MKSLASILLLLAVGTPSFAESGEVPEHYTKESHQWFQTVERGQTLRVVNGFGRIYARFGGYENKAEILATVQRLETDKAELVVSFTPVESGLEVRVGPATGPEGKAPASRREFETRDRIDLVVFVPLEVRLDAETYEDQIAVKKIKSDLSARSFKGDLRIRSVEGHVHAATDRGEISATLETGVTDKPQRLTTVTGDIEVHLWQDANMNVRLATSGEISTDFSIDIEHRDQEEPGKHGRATVGKGGPVLTLESKRGRVRLLRLPTGFVPADDED